MKKLSIQLSITDNCNLKCAHCCYDSGPGKDSMTAEGISAVVSNLPKSVDHIALTGGEVFTRKGLLYHALEQIALHGIDTKFIGIQTNGQWAMDSKTVSDTFMQLHDLGVDEIDLSSNSEYHLDAGLSVSRRKILAEHIKHHHFGMVRRVFGSEEFPLCFIGRGRYVDDGNIVCINYLQCGDNWYFTDTKGDVFPCCWKVPGTQIGNLIDETFEDISDRQARHRMLYALSYFGPKYVARCEGVDYRSLAADHPAPGKCDRCIDGFSSGKLKPLLDIVR